MTRRRTETATGTVAAARTDALAARVPVVAAVVPASRWQAERDAQDLTSFRGYRPDRTFATAGGTAP